MRPLIIQKFLLSKSLLGTVGVAGILLWIVLSVPVAVISYQIQERAFNSSTVKMQNSLEAIMVEMFESSARFGDLVNSRGLIKKLGLPLGLKDFRICVVGRGEISHSVFSEPCLPEAGDHRISISNEQLSLKFSWKTEGLDVMKSVARGIGASILFSLLITLLTVFIFFHAYRVRIKAFTKNIIHQGPDQDLSHAENRLEEMRPIVEAIEGYEARIKSYHIENEKSKREIEFAQVFREVAHDIRSPIGALNIAIQAMPEVNNEARELVRSSIKRINEIAKTLLDVSRNRKGNAVNPSRLTGKVSDLVALVREVVKEKTVTLASSSQVSIQLEDEFVSPIQVILDSGKFQRVISNLLDNSIKAATYRASEGLIRLSFNTDSEFCQIRIEDNGCGIPESVLKRLGSEPISYDLYGKSEGNGIGFFSSVQTINDFGGKVSIESKVNVGTTIDIVLPMSRPLNANRS